MTTATANGQAVPFDLDAAAEAAAGEAEGATFAFTYKGTRYEVPPTTTWPVSAFRDIANGDLETALSKLLGEDAFGGLADAGLRLGDLNLLFEEIARGSGLNLPNSRPPARQSSTRTPKRR